MKTKLFLSCLFLWLLTMPVRADISVNGVRYQVADGKAKAISLESGVRDVVVADSIDFENNSYPVCAIDEKLFYANATIRSVDIRAGLTSLPSCCFHACGSLEIVTLPTSLTSLPNYCFRACTSLKNVTLHEGITELGEGCFTGCRSISELALPISLNEIGNSAFISCSSLKHITIPEGVTTLKQKTFYNCISLDSLYLSANLQNMESNIFLCDTALVYIRCDAAHAPTAVGTTFDGIIYSKCEVCVPEGLEHFYSGAAGWKNFTWSPSWHDGLYHFLHDNIDIYIANNNIGATDSDIVGTLFTSITNEQVAELCGAGWRLPTHAEMAALINHCSVLDIYFPIMYSSHYDDGYYFSRMAIREYWIDNDEYFYTYYYSAARYPAVYECEIVHSGYCNEFYGDSGEHAVRPVRSANSSDITTPTDILHPIATYDLQGRPSTEGKGIRVEVLSNGKTRKVMVR